MRNSVFPLLVYSNSVITISFKMHFCEVIVLKISQIAISLTMRLDTDGKCTPSKGMGSTGTSVRSLVMEQFVAKVYLPPSKTEVMEQFVKRVNIPPDQTESILILGPLFWDTVQQSQTHAGMQFDRIGLALLPANPVRSSNQTNFGRNLMPEYNLMGTRYYRIGNLTHKSFKIKQSSRFWVKTCFFPKIL